MLHLCHLVFIHLLKSGCQFVQLLHNQIMAIELQWSVLCWHNTPHLQFQCHPSIRSCASYKWDWDHSHLQPIHFCHLSKMCSTMSLSNPATPFYERNLAFDLLRLLTSILLHLNTPPGLLSSPVHPVPPVPGVSCILLYSPWPPFDGQTNFEYVCQCYPSQEGYWFPPSPLLFSSSTRHLFTWQPDVALAGQHLSQHSNYCGSSTSVWSE